MDDVFVSWLQVNIAGLLRLELRWYPLGHTNVTIYFDAMGTVKTDDNNYCRGDIDPQLGRTPDVFLPNFYEKYGYMYPLRNKDYNK